MLDFYECLNKKYFIKKFLVKEGCYWWWEKEEDGLIWKCESYDVKWYLKECMVFVICDSCWRKLDMVENILVKNMIFLFFNDGFCEWNGY